MMVETFFYSFLKRFKYIFNKFFLIRTAKIHKFHLHQSIFQKKHNFILIHFHVLTNRMYFCTKLAVLCYNEKRKTEKVKLSADSIKKAKSFLSFLRPYRWLYSIGWIFLILSSFTAMLFPLLMGQLLGKDGADNLSSSPISSFDLPQLSVKGILLLMIVVFLLRKQFSHFFALLFFLQLQKER
jgi:hypothetical protein